MQRSDHHAAFHCFRQGLSTLLAGHSASPANEEYKTDDRGIINRERDNKRIIASVCLTADDEHCYDGVFGFFYRGLTLQEPSPTDLAQDQKLYSVLASAVLAYNYGLSRHLFGLKSGDSSQLAIAHDFYSIAYASLTSRGEFLAKLPISVNYCLLSTVNNIGHIHAYYRSIRKTAICSQELCLRLASIQPPLSEESRDEYRVFYLNICLFRESDFASASAA